MTPYPPHSRWEVFYKTVHMYVTTKTCLLAKVNDKKIDNFQYSRYFVMIRINIFQKIRIECKGRMHKTEKINKNFFKRKNINSEMHYFTEVAENIMLVLFNTNACKVFIQ